MTAHQSTDKPPGSGFPPPLPAVPPDLNSGKYSFDLLYGLVNSAVYFNMLAVSHPKPGTVIKEPGSRSQVTGFQIRNTLHRFECNLSTPTLGAGVKSQNRMGEFAGESSGRWMVVPDDFKASPLREPPPASLDASRSQRFVMYDAKITFGNGLDGFHGFGTGRTFPTRANGRTRLLVGAVGEMLEGFGKLTALHGTYVLSGELSPEHGFLGNIHVRLMDPEYHVLTDGSDIPPLQPQAAPDLGLTYILFGGTKPKDSHASYLFASTGQPQGIALDHQIRLVEFKFGLQGSKGLSSFAWPHEVGGKMTSKVFFNVFAPGAAGSSLTPIPSTASLEFTFSDAQGQTVATIAAQGAEGKVFNDTFPAAPGQAGWRFGTVLTLGNGTGLLAGAEGIVTENSIASIAPYVDMAVYTLCLNDPQGKYRAVL